MEENDRQEILKQFEILKKLADVAKDEDILRSYIVCMMRLLNGLSQIQVSSFYRYENIILSIPMKIFCTYFIDAVKEALLEEDALEKELDIRDIEENICALNDIYENVINGTANSDKQMFMSMPMNSSTYGISPKLYAAYEGLINMLVKIYDDEKQDEYAFLLNPTLKNMLYAETLFKRRKKSGKVVIIHMPVRMLEKTNQIPLYLIHEVFHVLTKQERKRKSRARYLLMAVLMQVGYCLFDGVSFCDNEKINKSWKTKLLDNWIDQVFEKYKKVNGRDELDRFFYSVNIKSYIIELANKMLREIELSLSTDVGELIYKEYNNQKDADFNKYDKLTKGMIEQLEVIRNNIWRMDYYGLITAWTEELMFVFRESYADMACLITSKYSLKQYKKAFKESVRFRMSDVDLAQDGFYQIRQLLMEAVFENKTFEDADIFEISVKHSISARQTNNTYDMIMRPEILNIYKEYLMSCKARLETSMDKKKKELVEFQNQIDRFKNMDFELVQDILIGNI